MAAGCCSLPAIVWLPQILEEGCTEPPQRNLLLVLMEVSVMCLGTQWLPQNCWGLWPSWLLTTSKPFANRWSVVSLV